MRHTSFKHVRVGLIGLNATVRLKSDQKQFVRLFASEGIQVVSYVS